MDIYLLLKLVSDPSRLKILYILTLDEYCVGEIQEISELSQANVSKHLKKLLKSNIVCKSQQKQMSYFSLNKDYVKVCKIFTPIMDTFEDTQEAKQIIENVKSLKRM